MIFPDFSLTFPVCSKFPDFSLTGKCLPIFPGFPGFPVRVGTLISLAPSNCRKSRVTSEINCWTLNPPSLTVSQPVWNVREKRGLDLRCCMIQTLTQCVYMCGVPIYVPDIHLSPLILCWLPVHVLLMHHQFRQLSLSSPGKAKRHCIRINTKWRSGQFEIAPINWQQLSNQYALYTFCI